MQQVAHQFIDAFQLSGYGAKRIGFSLTQLDIDPYLACLIIGGGVVLIMIGVKMLVV